MISTGFPATTNECECAANEPGCYYDSVSGRWWTNCDSAIEHEVNELASIRVASVTPAGNANNGNCDRVPARMGYGGNHATTYRTITVGGTMYIPGYFDTYDDRWTCAATPEGCQPNWGEANQGSNYGSCVSIWAPAWNVRVAGGGGPNDYRTPGGASSGTSWSAPYVAGVIARHLERNPWWTVDQVWNQLVADANLRANTVYTPDFDPSGTFNNRLIYMSPTQ